MNGQEVDNITDTTEGFFSRWVVVPFSAFFPASRADPLLIHRLTREGELQGLLRAAVSGLQSVMRRGSFTLPPSVSIATERFRMEADPVRGFIEERVRNGGDHSFVERQDLYMSYTVWAGVNGFHQMSAQRFYESFGASGVDLLPYVRTTYKSGTRGYRGIELA